MYDKACIFFLWLIRLVKKCDLVKLGGCVAPTLHGHLRVGNFSYAWGNNLTASVGSNAY